MNRRDAIKGLAGMTIGTVSCVLLPAKERAGKPEKLEPGQIWRDQWGDIRIVQVPDPRVATCTLWQTYSFPKGLYAWVPDYSWRHWTYLGNIRDLGGAR